MEEVACVGAVVTDRQGRLLLVRRGHPPQAGTWSLPGGRVEAGETPERAVIRELAEETGLRAEVLHWVGRVSRPGADGVTYLIDDFRCRITGGLLGAGDDASDVMWAEPDELPKLNLSLGLLDALRDWSVLTRADRAVRHP
ncbi:MAG: NUDIX hydrolase [Mycobacteriales bacterium]